jgi:F-box protein, helicase, 18
MKLTPEQIAIINSSGDIKINAVAGSGKTTTLIEYAKARNNQGRILYLAFNKSVKIEAERKFAEAGVTNVQIETAHSLAFHYTVKGTGYKVKKEGGYRTAEIAEILGLNGYDQKNVEYVLANHINKFTTYFCNSAAGKVQALEYEDILFDAKARQFATSFRHDIYNYTRQLLAKMDRGEIELTHDFYLKKFQQSKPVLPYDFILFDEGQDASEAMLNVFLNQRCTKVIVGDTHQQIYGWRYAVNSLEKVDFPTFHLSSSFRFDNEIAALAVRILGWKKHYNKQFERVIINGFADNEEVQTKAVIARTNIALLVKAIELIIEKKEVSKVYFEGRIETYTYADDGASIYDVLNLHTGKRHLIKDKLIASMPSTVELKEYIEQTEDAQLDLILKVVEKYEVDLPLYIKTIKENHLESNDKHTAQMVFSTVHRCKGMEYDEVTLTEDFITEEKLVRQLEETGAEKLNLAKLSEEINLLYVAVTRTRCQLNIPELLLPKSSINRIVKEEPATPLAPGDLQEFRQYLPQAKVYSLDKARQERKNSYQSWTEEDDSRLQSLMGKLVPPKEIARLMGRTIGSIKARVEKLEDREFYDLE